MTDIVLNPRSLVTAGAVVSASNPLPVSSQAAGTTVSAAALNPFTPVVEGAIVSVSNPLPISLDATLRSATISWMQAVVAAGGTVSPTQLYRVNTLIGSLIDGGVWDKAVDIAIRSTENTYQAYVSLKLLQTITPHNSPYFTPYWGVGYDGVSMYDDWGIKPGDYPTFITPTSMEISVREQTNIGETTTSIGCLSSNDNLLIVARSSANVVLAQLESSAIQGPTNLNAARLMSALREGSTYSFRAAGAALGTGTPSASGSAFPNITLTWGARHLAASVDGFRACVIAAGGVFSPLTLAQEVIWNSATETYLASITARAATALYVSSVNFGGIPVGSDSNAGTIGAPYLTITRGLFGMPPDGIVSLNGNPAAPTSYTSAVPVLLNFTSTLKAQNAGGAQLIGTGSQEVLTIGLSDGGTGALDGLIIDASDNDGGPASRCISIGGNITSQYTVSLTDCTLQTWTNQAIRSDSGTTQNINLVLDGVDFIAAAGMAGAVNLLTLTDGDVTITGGSTDVQCNSSAGGGHRYNSTTGGGTVTVTDYTLAVNAIVGFSGTSFAGMDIRNKVGLINGGTYTITSDISGALPNAHSCLISQGRLTDSTQFDISGSKILNVTARNSSYGGSCLQIGDDSADRNLAQDVEIGFSDGIGHANFQAAGGHALFLCHTVRGWVHDVALDLGGLGFVDKANLNALFEDNTATDCTSSYYLNKASHGSVCRRLRTLSHVGYAAPHISYSVGDNEETGVAGDGIFEDCYFENDGGIGVTFVSVDAVGATFGFGMTGCHFELTSGTLASSPFVVNGVSYATFALFNAAYPGNTANFP